MAENEPQRGLSVPAIWIVLRRHIRVVAACVIVVPLAALAISLLQGKEYTASASLLFRGADALGQNQAGASLVAPNPDATREAETDVKLVSLRAVAARTSRALGGGLSTDDVAGRVAVAAQGQSNVVSVTATDPSPRRAARIANTFAEQYIVFRRDADRAKIAQAQQTVDQQLSSLAPDQQNSADARSLRAQAQQLKLQTSLQTGNAELIQSAAIPESPSSPKTKQNVLLGALLGLLIGIALALLIERFDRRVRDPDEVEEIFGRPILGTIPHSATLDRLGPAREGPLPFVEAEAFQMLRANLRYFNVDRQVRSVVIVSPAPGDGKTTVAWNLASTIAASGSRVLLIEADLRRPSIAASSEQLEKSPGLSTVLSGRATLGRAVQSLAVRRRTNESQPDPRLDVLVAGSVPPNPDDLLESESMRELLHEAHENYELVVIDTPPTSLVPDAIPLFGQVSGLITVVRLGKSQREVAAHLATLIDRIGTRNFGVVVNDGKVDAKSYGYYDWDRANGSAGEDEVKLELIDSPDEEDRSEPATESGASRRRI